MNKISDGFRSLLQRIQPSRTEVVAAGKHLSAIETRLRAAFRLKKFFRAGSFSRGTSIRGKSDVDAYAVISLDDIRWGSGWRASTTVLDNFRTDLSGRFPSTSVYRDVQATVVDFAECRVDVVPAAWAGFSEQFKRPLYWIPDGGGNWMQTSPELHNDYLRRENTKSRGKLRAVAQLMKYWRECRSPRIPLSSFHIEMVLASEGICRSVKSYAQLVEEVLQSMAERDCAAIRDPFGISGNIPAIRTGAQRDAAVASVRSSREHAKAALIAQGHQDWHEAKRQWNIVFNYKFPA